MSQSTHTGLGEAAAALAPSALKRLAATSRASSKRARSTAVTPSTPHHREEGLPTKSGSATRKEGVDSLIAASTELIAQRLCAKVALSALFAFAAGPLVAQAASAESPTLLWLGLSSVALAVAVQVEARTSARVALMRQAVQQGGEPGQARRAAREQVRAWLS